MIARCFSYWKARSTALDLRESRIPHADIFLAQELGRGAVLNAQVAVSKQKKFDGFIRERDATQLLRFRLLNELPQRLTIQFDQLLGCESICGPELLEFVRRKPVRRLALGDILYGELPELVRCKLCFIRLHSELLFDFCFLS